MQTATYLLELLSVSTFKRNMVSFLLFTYHKRELFSSIGIQKMFKFFITNSILHNKSMKCPRCESTQINKNGRHHGKQNYICKRCGRQFVEFSNSRGYSDDAKKICLKMHANGMGFRAIERITGVSHNTIINWVRQADSVSSNACESEENPESNPEVKDVWGEVSSSVRFVKNSYPYITTLPKRLESSSIYLNHDPVVQLFGERPQTTKE